MGSKIAPTWVPKGSKMAPQRREHRSKLPPGGLLGASREPELIFNAFVVSLGALLGAPGALLGRSWGALGATWGST